MFASVGADGSVRMFDLRHLEHSTIIYEDPQHHPLLRLCWNKQDPNYLATMAMDGMEVRTPLQANLGPATPLQPSFVDPGKRFSADGSFLPRGFLDPLGDVLDCPSFRGSGGAGRGGAPSVWELGACGAQDHSPQHTAQRYPTPMSVVPKLRKPDLE